MPNNILRKLFASGVFDNIFFLNETIKFVKGTVSTRFFTYVFFSSINTPRASIHALKYFRISFQIRGYI
jgi:hypothetical protein